MKKLAILISCALFGLAQPPTAPSIPLPKECKTIPPMIIFLPPPMEKELIPCKNRVFLPSLAMVKKRFPKAVDVKPVEGFERLYEIDLENNQTLFCNKELLRCIKGDLLR